MNLTRMHHAAGALLLAGGLVCAGCDTTAYHRTADRDTAAPDGERLVTGEGSSSWLYAEGDDQQTMADRDRGIDRNRGDETISRARPASARVAETEVRMNMVSIAFPADEELLLLEARGPMEVRPNEPYEYEVDVTNVGDYALANIRISEHASSNLDFLGAEPQTESNDVGNASWTIDRLEPGETRTIIINAQATEAGPADLCLTASVMPLVCLVTEAVQPELQLTKTGPSDVLRCEPIEYTITVSNTGVGAARNVRIIDELPQGLTHEGRQRVEIEVGTLEAGATKEFPITVEATSTGEFTNRARVTAEGGLSQEAEYTLAVSEPRLQITKSGPTQDYMGVPLEYEITVTNVGDAPAQDAVLTESMPDGASFESATLDGRETGDRVTWDLGTISPGESKTVSMRMRVNEEGEFVNTAIATAYCAEEVQATARTVLTGIPGLLLEVVDTEDPVRIGTETTYEIRVTNQGSKTARDIRIAAQLEPHVSFVSAEGPTEHQPEGEVADGEDADQMVAFDSLRALEPGKTAVWTITVRGEGEADSRFFVEMNSAELEGPVRETESTHIYQGQ